ncbi:hypothetical protein C0993_005397, partial [Termitomyces sp. T159_Od127]
DEERESSKGKRKASPPLLPTDKGKKRVRVVSPAAVTPEIESEDDKEDEACRLGAAIKASKAALGVEDLAGLSRQVEVPQDVGASHEEIEQDEAEEEAEVRPEAASQAQFWGWGLPQWSWLLEWGANDSTTWDVSSGDEPESWEPRRRVTAREAFEWLEEDLAHPVVPLQLAMFLERMEAWAAQMERLLEQERKAVRAELMGLHLRYSTLWQSVETLHDYQEDVTQALEWQEENNVQEGDLLPLCDLSLPFDDD